MTTNLTEVLAKMNGLYKAIDYDGDFSPCSEIRFYQASDDLLSAFREAMALLEELHVAVTGGEMAVWEMQGLLEAHGIGAKK
jgi:hypothetical protein